MNRSLMLAIALAILAILWMVSGTFSEKEVSPAKHGEASAESAQNMPVFKVKTERMTARKMQDEITLQGAVEAAREIEVRAETQGIIEQIHARKGDSLNAGQAILSLAMNDRQARLEKAKAALSVKQIELASSQSLKDKNMISENQHQQRLADLVSAQAEVKAIEVEIAQTQIRAAFKGVLNEVHVELGDYVSPGSALATLVDQEMVTIATEVPQQHIASLELGQTVKATLLNGTGLTGKLNYISASAHPKTRTFRIEAQAPNMAGVRHFGQSARVRLFLGERSAYYLSASLLNLSSDGRLQIKTLDAENKVRSHDVTIIRSDNKGLWLSGLPAEINLITVGQGFVAENEEVQSQTDEIK